MNANRSSRFFITKGIFSRSQVSSSKIIVQAIPVAWGWLLGYEVGSNFRTVQLNSRVAAKGKTVGKGRRIFVEKSQFAPGFIILC